MGTIGALTCFTFVIIWMTGAATLYDLLQGYAFLCAFVIAGVVAAAVRTTAKWIERELGRNLAKSNKPQKYFSFRTFRVETRSSLVYQRTSGGH